MSLNEFIQRLPWAWIPVYLRVFEPIIMVLFIRMKFPAPSHLTISEKVWHLQSGRLESIYLCFLLLLWLLELCWCSLIIFSRGKRAWPALKSSTIDLKMNSFQTLVDIKMMVFSYYFNFNNSKHPLELCEALHRISRGLRCKWLSGWDPFSAEWLGFGYGSVVRAIASTTRDLRL